VAAIVEKFDAYAGPHGLRRDLFGIIDVLALDPQTGIIGVQSCGNSYSEHVRKILEDRAQETVEWLSTPGTSFELWSWRKILRNRGGKQRIWSPRVASITLDSSGDIVITEHR